MEISAELPLLHLLQCATKMALVRRALAESIFFGAATRLGNEKLAFASGID